MSSDDDFIAHLMGFGLTEKEAECYFYLLKYGPKTPSPLAKSLKTYREDVHRTLQSLIDKGMVRPSFDSPTLYTAVELETALESALKKHEAELHEKERRKRALEELAQQQRFSPSDEVSTFKIIKSGKELLTISLPLVSALEKEWVSVSSSSIFVICSQLGIFPLVKELVDRGGKARAVVADLVYSTIPALQEGIETGAEIRYSGHEGESFVVLDKKISISGIGWETSLTSRAASFVTALWTDDPGHARRLTNTFEQLWEHSIPVEERIEALLKDGPPRG
ncbi:MAG: TrmB family transcriptional regulator [Halobacteriota archaeon]